MKKGFGKGWFLIARASLGDPNFQHSVVLICEHDTKGSYGLILNQPVHEPEELLDEMPFLQGRLYQGGPVQLNALQIMHTYGNEIENSLEIIPGVRIGGNFEHIRKGIGNGTLSPDNCKFFLGYSGWSAGQLEAEFKTGSWEAIPATKDLVITADYNKLWALCIRRLAEENPIYSNFPENPTWN